jgi:hypothetical protein
MVCQTVGLSALFVLYVVFESLSLKEHQPSSERMLSIIRGTSVVASILFGIHVMSAQKRFKLKVK